LDAERLTREQGMKLVRCVVLVAVTAAAAPAGAAPAAENKGDKDELLTLYLLSVAAERCGFTMSGKQADAIDREIKALVQKLQLRPREHDAIYSAADVTFERQACDRNGDFAKGFRETLQRLSGP
jgi:hypothetical protein